MKSKLFVLSALAVLAISVVGCKKTPPASTPVSDLLVQPSVKLFEGETLNLDVTVVPANADNRLLWRSFDPDIATVDEETGLITALATGAASIEVWSAANFRVSKICTVIVNKRKVPVTGIELDQTSIEKTLRLGKWVEIKAKVYPENADNKKVKWSSEGDNIFGNFSFLSDEKYGLSVGGYGTLTVTATTLDGEFSTKCVVTIKKLK